jgi:hypothetical protein
MGLNAENQIEDLIEDEVGLCLRELHTHKTWTTEKIQLFNQLMQLTTKNGYVRFKGDFRDYHLERKGQSCIYVIPENQRGALKTFRGKRVRLICELATDRYAGKFFLVNSVQDDFSQTVLSKSEKTNTGQ